jgi:hypothetical protein
VKCDVAAALRCDCPRTFLPNLVREDGTRCNNVHIPFLSLGFLMQEPKLMTFVGVCSP